MESAIDRLEQEIWAACVRQRLAQDPETLERWRSDQVSHIRERFIIDPMPPSLQPLVDEANTQWEHIESSFLSRRALMDKERFLSEFEAARSSLLQGTKEWGSFALIMGQRAWGVVRNLHWVNLFAWVLPTADPGNRSKHAAIGIMAAAIFYTEAMERHRDGAGTTLGDPLVAIDARWKLANLAITGGDS
jgi:hypothetical protein